MKKELKIDNIYIGLEKKEEYSEFLEEYELWEDHVLLEKTNYEFNLGNTSVCIFRNISDDINIYVDKNGFVLSSIDDITGEKRYHKIEDIISLNDLLKRFKSEKREDCQYRRYVMPIFEKLFNLLDNKDTIDINSLNKIFGNINDIHSYIFGFITEDEYEDLFGCRTYDFSTGSRIRK